MNQAYVIITIQTFKVKTVFRPEAKNRLETFFRGKIKKENPYR